MFVVDSTLPQLVVGGDFFFDHGGQLGGGVILNLHIMVEDKHQDGREQQENKNAPDLAKKFATMLCPNFPPSVNLNPFVYLARRDFHV